MQFRGEYYFLSNMYPCTINYGGHTYKCAEAAFQAQKCPSRAKEFEKLDGYAAKKLGRRVNLRNNWAEIKVDIMKDILWSKFNDNEILHDIMADKRFTEPIVEENTWHDTYWGVCGGKGENVLGKLLTEIRNKIQGE